MCAQHKLLSLDQYRTGHCIRRGLRQIFVSFIVCLRTEKEKKIQKISFIRV